MSRVFTPAEAAACSALVALALREDLGDGGDRTSLATIPASETATAAFVARSPGVLAGLPTVRLVCAAVDPSLVLNENLADGTLLKRGDVVATVAGPLRAILAAERTALNFLQRLSGVASITRRYVDLARGTRARVLDTRKTTPGWRPLEKYAVRMGGGHNHRIGLYDAILIKDNHIAGVASVHPETPARRAVELARAYPGNAGLAVEVEVDTLDQLKEVLAVKPEIVLLDNMGPDLLRQAVKLRDAASPGTLLEASGGINEMTIAAVAATGIDRISVGALTHSAPALDIGLDFVT